MRRALVLFFLAACAAVPAPAAAADPPPALVEPAASRLGALRCYGDLARAPGLPVLLVHGTNVDADGNWHWGYRKALLETGHGVCTVDMPNYATGDVQRSVEYVVTGIREVHRRSGGRKLSIVGHSQGGFQPVFALRVWADLAPMVDDFVGLAGAYDNRSRALSGGCAGMCIAAFKQISAGSRFANQLARRRLPAGPSYTAVATLFDDTVTPQPRSNELPYGAGRSIQIQDICPGRRFPVAGLDHIAMAGDAVAYELVMDALSHPGTADPARISRSVCANLLFFPRADLIDLAVRLPAIFGSSGQGTPVADEPPLRCYMDPACPEKRLTGARLTRRGGSVVLRLRADQAGLARVRLKRTSTRRRAYAPMRAFALPAGLTTRRLRTAGLRPGRYVAEVQTRGEFKSGYVRERSLRLRIR